MTDEKGEWTGTFDLPTHRFGCYGAPRWLGCQQNFATCYQPSTSTCRSRRTP